MLDKAKSGDDEKPEIAFTDYADLYARDVIAHNKGKERELEILAVLRPAFDPLLLSAIDRDRVRGWMTDRASHVSAATTNREVDLLKAMLRDAVPKYLKVSPIYGMKRLRIVKPRRRLMTGQEEKRLLEKADHVERALLLLGLDGLIRMASILDLQQSDRKGGWIRVNDPKSGNPYDVALSARCAAALDAITVKGDAYYFDRYRGAKTARDRRSRVRRAVKLLCKRADVLYGKAKGGLTFHWATRRTGATKLVVDKKAPIPAVMKQGNWVKPNVLLEIYADADKAAQRKAIDSLTPHSRGKRKTPVKSGPKR